MKTLLVILGSVCTLASAQDVNFGDSGDSSSPSEEFDTSEDTSEKTEDANTRFFQGNNGGFNNGGFDNGGFNNGGFDNGGFNNGGFNNGQNGGLTLGGLLNGQNGGLNNGGFNNGQNGGFSNGGFNNGGFNNGQNGGFNNGGFNNGQNGGFNNGGFNNGQNGGFNNGGFNNGQCGCQCRPDLTFQYNGRVQGNCRTPDQTGRLWCYTTGPVGTCGDLQPSQRFPNNPWSYNACRAQLTCGGGGGFGSSLGVRSSVKTRDCEGRPTGDEYFGCGCETRKKRQLTFTQDESKADTEKDADRCAEADLAGKIADSPDF